MITTLGCIHFGERMAAMIIILTRLTVAALGIFVFGDRAVQAQSILTDVQDKSVIHQLDELKRRDAQGLYGLEQAIKLKYYPLVIFVPGILGSKIDECDGRADDLTNCVPIWG